MSSLAELISDESIVLDVEASDWVSAIRRAGALLESSGVATEAYTQAMIDNVTEHGPYIVIAPGFAFAHARPSEAVRHTGMSWVRLAEPVNFGHESHDPVSFVVALAATDSSAHTQAMADLARVLGAPEKRAALDIAASPAVVRAIISGQDPAQVSSDEIIPEDPSDARSTPSLDVAGEEQHLVLTVCGNGLGTSLFLKNTLEQVLDNWGWSRHLTVEATDTISARGRAGEAKAILTSGEIARTLGDVGIPVRVIANFTSTDELDAALRDIYDV